MSIDYGRKRVGLAVSDPLRIFAVGLDTVPSHEAVAYIAAYCAKEPVDYFVLGYPMNLDNRPSEIVPQVEAFEKHLQRTFPTIPVQRADERFTSQLALRALREGGLKKKARQDKATVDRISAVLILQLHLDVLNNAL